MKHTISLTSQDYIEICFIGPIAFEHVRTLGEHLVVLHTQLGDAGKDVRIRIDSQKATELHEDAHTLAKIILKHTSFAKLAFIETREKVLKRLTQEVAAAHIDGTVRIYANHQKAEIWLVE